MIALFRKQPASFYRSLRMLSMPIILQNLITTALGFTDTFMVGLLGNEQMLCRAGKALLLGNGYVAF